MNLYILIPPTLKRFLLLLLVLTCTFASTQIEDPRMSAAFNSVMRHVPREIPSNRSTETVSTICFNKCRSTFPLSSHPLRDQSRTGYIPSLFNLWWSTPFPTHTEVTQIRFPYHTKNVSQSTEGNQERHAPDTQTKNAPKPHRC